MCLLYSSDLNKKRLKELPDAKPSAAENPNPCLFRLVVRTLPFHGSNGNSIFPRDMLSFRVFLFFTLKACTFYPFFYGQKSQMSFLIVMITFLGEKNISRP